MTYTKNDLIEFAQTIKDYISESRSIFGHDEREAEEFVNIFLRNRSAVLEMKRGKYFFLTMPIVLRQEWATLCILKNSEKKISLKIELDCTNGIEVFVCALVRECSSLWEFLCSGWLMSEEEKTHWKEIADKYEVK